jgi:hypothetical protein
MKLKITVRCLFLAALAGAIACGSDNGTGTPPTPAKIRVVNSVFQYTDATNTASKVAPRSIDMLVDSATSSPGAIAIAPVSIFAPAGTDSSYYEQLPAGVHSFTGRLTGSTGQTSSFYTNSVNNLPYLARQYLVSATPYTIVVAGIVPVTAATGTAQALTPSTAAPFVALLDDPFPPPQVNGAYQTRFRIVNAAPFAAATGLGATVSAYLTPGTTPPASVATLSPTATALYRSPSVYINADAGTYTLTFTVGAVILSQSTVTFAAGEVRTFVLQSTAYAATPSVANHVVRALLDNKY